MLPPPPLHAAVAAQASDNAGLEEAVHLASGAVVGVAATPLGRVVSMHATVRVRVEPPFPHVVGHVAGKYAPSDHACVVAPSAAAPPVLVPVPPPAADGSVGHAAVAAHVVVVSGLAPHSPRRREEEEDGA